MAIALLPRHTSIQTCMVSNTGRKKWNEERDRARGVGWESERGGVGGGGSEGVGGGKERQERVPEKRDRPRRQKSNPGREEESSYFIEGRTLILKPK